MTLTKGNKIESKWYDKPLIVVIIGAFLAFLFGIWLYKITQGQSDFDNYKTKTQKSAPNLNFSVPKIDRESGIAEFSFSNSNDSNIYLTGAGNDVITLFHAEDETGKNLEILDFPQMVASGSSGVILVDTSEAEGKIVLKHDCEETVYNSNLKIEKLDCIPRSIETSKELLLPDYKGLRILGIDATFKDDNIDFSVAKEYFKSKESIFYGTQSPGRKPDEGVLRIDAKLFEGRKILFIFYNDANNISKENIEFIKKDLSGFFTHLDDVILYSFTDYENAMDIQTEDSDIRYIFGFIGDCNLKAHGGCSSQLNGSGKYPLFTKRMMGNELDILFIVPATLETKRISDNK